MCISLHSLSGCPRHALLEVGADSLDSVTSHSFGARRTHHPSTFACVHLLMPTPCVSLPSVCHTLCPVSPCLFSKVDASPNLVITSPVATEKKEEAYRKSAGPRESNNIYHGSILADRTDGDSPVGTQEDNKRSSGWVLWRHAMRFGWKQETIGEICNHAYNHSLSTIRRSGTTRVPIRAYIPNVLPWKRQITAHSNHPSHLWNMKWMQNKSSYTARRSSCSWVGSLILEAKPTDSRALMTNQVISNCHHSKP